MKSCTKGMVSEIKAVVWFLENGFEVFQNVKPYGPADLVIWKEGMTSPILIDVKTISVYVKADGSKSYLFAGMGNKGHNYSKYKVKKNIHYLGYYQQSDLFMWFDADPTINIE